MSDEKSPASKELEGADAALRRAAITAKRLAELNGTPYVVYDRLVSNPVQQSAQEIDEK